MQVLVRENEDSEEYYMEMEEFKTLIDIDINVN